MHPHDCPHIASRSCSAFSTLLEYSARALTCHFLGQELATAGDLSVIGITFLSQQSFKLDLNFVIHHYMYFSYDHNFYL